MTARARMLTRLQAVARQTPDYTVGGAEAGIWLDDLDAVEAEARAAERARIRAGIEALEVHEDVWWPDDEALDVRLLLLDDVLAAVDNPPDNDGEAARKLGEALG